jgi:hypothetical protein
MATTYRSPVPDLNSVMAQQAMSTPQDQPVSEMSPNASQDITPTLLQMLMKPSDVGTAPQVHEPKLWQKILAGIGDSLGAYASVLGGQDVQPHTMDKLNAQLLRQQEDLQRWQEKNASAQNEAKLRGAQFLLSENDRKQYRNDQLEFQKQAKAATLLENKAKLDQIAAEKASALAQQQAQFEATKDWEKTKLRLQGEQEASIARIHQKAQAGDESAKYDQKTTPEIMDYISGAADVAKVALAGGDPAAKIPGMTKEQMTARVRRRIEGSGVSPDAKKALYAFAERELGQEIRDFEQSQAAQVQQGTTVEMPQVGSPLEMSLGGAVQKAFPSLAK